MSEVALNTLEEAIPGGEVGRIDEVAPNTFVDEAGSGPETIEEAPKTTKEEVPTTKEPKPKIEEIKHSYPKPDIKSEEGDDMKIEEPEEPVAEPPTVSSESAPLPETVEELQALVLAERQKYSALATKFQVGYFLLLSFSPSPRKKWTKEKETGKRGIQKSK
jgi:hypothetical protein